MRLITFRDSFGVRPGALHSNLVIALDSIAPDMLSLIDLGAEGLAQAADHIARVTADSNPAPGSVQPLSGVQLLAPIPRPRQNVICIGMNYTAHAIESARARGREPKLPEVPVFFTKAANTVCAPGAVIPLDPRVTLQLDYEGELAFIFGRTAKNVPAAKALDVVFGYSIVNDISARDLQERHQQFFRGKSLDCGCPLGPCIVTADEIPDPGALHVTTRVNGEIRQDSTVGDLIFDVPHLIEFLTLGLTVEPGTIVSTGTPFGVGLGKTPQVWLQAGDRIEIEIQPIGVLYNSIGAV